MADFRTSLNNFSDKGIELIGKSGNKVFDGISAAKAKAAEATDKLGSILGGGGEHKPNEKKTDVRDTTLGNMLSQGLMKKGNHRDIMETGDVPD